MDIKPPRKRPAVRPTPAAPQPPQPVKAPQLDPIAEVPTGLQPVRRWNRRRIITTIVISVAGLIGLLAAAALLWYQLLLSPLSDNLNEKTLVTIESGTAPKAIGDLLEQKGIVRSSFAFGIYTRLSGTQNGLQAGTYRLSPAESTPQIVEHLTNGTVDTFDITFLPGATLEENRQVFLDAGYSQAEVDAALSASYESPIFAGKPAKEGLEGFIYGDTYRFGSGATVAEILEHTFAHYAQIIEENDLVTLFKKHGLNLYQGITLASIVQREAVGGDEAQIAQVFYSRMKEGMKLGSDVTYQYIADKEGIPRDPNLDSPYNTRRYEGLPPGPIATPGLAALQAVAKPAKGNYLFFLSGDDDVTYFARTNEEHEKNIAEHCKVKCQTL